jgi:hypothetical protein
MITQIIFVPVPLDIEAGGGYEEKIVARAGAGSGNRLSGTIDSCVANGAAVFSRCFSGSGGVMKMDALGFSGAIAGAAAAPIGIPPANLAAPLFAPVEVGSAAADF